MKYTIKFIDNVMLSPADGRKVLVNFAKGETFRAQKIGEANGLAVFGFQRDGIPFSIIPDTMQNKVLLIPQTTDYTTLPSDIQDMINNNPSVGNMIGTPGSPGGSISPSPKPLPIPDKNPLSGLGLTPTSALLVGGLVLLSFYIIFKK